MEASPTLEEVLAAVQAGDYTKVVLRPLMIVAGDHANNDMVGDEEGSWKTAFEEAGYEVTVQINGLGELEAIPAAAGGPCPGGHGHAAVNSRFRSSYIGQGLAGESRLGPVPMKPGFFLRKEQRHKMNGKRLLAAAVAAMVVLSACASPEGEEAAPSSQEVASGSSSQESGAVASADEMAPVETVVEEGMVPIGGEKVLDGVYTVQVDSSSSMFQVIDCQLTVENGQMTAVMTMGGTGYLYLYPGTGEGGGCRPGGGVISPLRRTPWASTPIPCRWKR